MVGATRGMALGGHERQGGEDVDQLAGQRGGERWRLGGCGCAGGRGGRGGGGGRDGGEFGEDTRPRDEAFTGQRGQAERERLRACVQDGVAQLFVAGVGPGAVGESLASIRAQTRLCSRGAR